jgi:hypothetical protein
MQLKKFQASILAVTMIILGIMIITALSVSMVSIKERKVSMGEAKSGQAFQNAQSGVELVMKEITKGGYSTIGDICATTAYTDTTSYKVVLKKADDSEINCTTNASDPISEIASIKSTGTGSGQQRAIEAAVAATGVSKKICAYWSTNSDKWVTGLNVPLDFTEDQCQALALIAFVPPLTVAGEKLYELCCFDATSPHGLDCGPSADPVGGTAGTPSSNCGW